MATITNTKPYLIFARFLALLLTFATGFTGLVYEVLWHRYLANLLGSQARAAAVILAAFLGGLCLGYLLFGRISRNKSPRYAVACCGLVELGIGLWAFIFPWLYNFLWRFSQSFPYNSWQATASELVMSAVLMGVPTILMGGTLPLLTQGLASDLEDASPLHARVYAVNTGGAFLGCLLSGFVFLPAWGLGTSLFRAGLVNIIAGILLVLLALGLSPVLVERDNAHKDRQSPLPQRAPRIHPKFALAVAFLGGFYAISLQVVFMRLVALSSGASEYSFCMTVAAFVLMLALGAWSLANSRFLRFPLWLNQAGILLSLMGLFYTVYSWPYWSYVFRTFFRNVWPNFYNYHALLFLGLTAVLGVPVGLMGRTMPLLFRSVAVAQSELGRTVGLLYGANTLGCVLGALLGGYYLLYFVNLDLVFQFSVVLCALSVVLAVYGRLAVSVTNATTLRHGERTFAVLLTGVVVLAVVMFLSPVSRQSWNYNNLQSGLFRYSTIRDSTYLGPSNFYEEYRRSSKMIAYKDDPNTTVSVGEREASPSEQQLNNGAKYVRSIHVNGKSDGETSHGDMKTMRMTAHIPMLFSPVEVVNVAVAGFGLGVTIGVTSLYPEVQDIHCLEISPAIKEYAPYFDFANHGVSVNPRVRWSIGDAYRVLGAESAQYSLIISEPSNPWVTGVERLFAKEFYQLVKARLKPGGTYMQWFHTYSISEATFAMVMRTFGSSFKQVRLFHLESDVIMLGTDAEFDGEVFERLRQRYESNSAVRLSLQQVGVTSIEGLLAKEIPIPPLAFRDASLHTLEHPRLAYAAGKDFFMDETTNLLALARRSWLMPWIRRASARSLVGEWLSRTARPTESMQRFSAAACERVAAGFFPRWEVSADNCHDSLVALAVINAISSEEDLDQQTLGLIKNLLSFPQTPAHDLWQDVAPKVTIEQARAIIRVFRNYDSAFVPMAVDKLVTATVVCRDSTETEALLCQQELGEALALAGQGTAARAVLAHLAQKGKSLGLDWNSEHLESVVEQALAAEAAITE